MGLLVAQMRLSQINRLRSDTEYQIQLISSAKLSLTAQINEMTGFASDMDPDSPEMKAFEKKKERLYQAEKSLDAQLQRYQTTLQMLDAEEQSVKQMRDNAIQRCYA